VKEILFERRIVMLSSEESENLGFFNVDDISELIGMKRGAIYAAISRGKDGTDIPPSVTFGRKRRWRKVDYIEWERKLD
jgi:predicted DNA-binding transcriptional regulator AlpA